MDPPNDDDGDLPNGGWSKQLANDVLEVGGDLTTFSRHSKRSSSRKDLGGAHQDPLPDDEGPSFRKQKGSGSTRTVALITGSDEPWDGPSE
ncbi:hypothetical protein CEXT_652741 [Caerostris extrusa]|uniref:Uncharacterized protein n=1 Tax=Caerostris extrusa TaxID=172846 RepID=A0AAV4M2U8_CAEEX|nr:hypothetical protein CEXT_652741 [Caerostris extrusa]